MYGNACMGSVLFITLSVAAVILDISSNDFYNVVGDVFSNISCCII